MAHEDTFVKVSILSKEFSILPKCNSQNQFGHAQFGVWGWSTSLPSPSAGLSPFNSQFSMSSDGNISEICSQRGKISPQHKERSHNQGFNNEKNKCPGQKGIPVWGCRTSSYGVMSCAPQSPWNPDPGNVVPLGLLQGPFPSIPEWLW